MGKGDRRLTARELRKLRNSAAAERKKGKRTDSGRLSRAAGARQQEPKGPPPIVDARVRHLGVSQGDAETAYAGTGHGLLLLASVITHDGYQIAERYRRLRNAYQRVTFRGPKEATSAALPYCGEYQGGRQSDGADGDRVPVAWSEVIETPEEREQRVRRDWEATEACLAFCGPALRVLNDVCIRDHDIRQDERDQRWFVLGVKKLAELWGQDPRDMVPDRQAA